MNAEPASAPEATARSGAQTAVYRPYVDTAPAARWPEDQWTRIRDHWWFFRSHDD